MLPHPELDAETATLGGKCPLGATIPWNCFEKVIWAVAMLDFIPLLGVIPGPSQVLVDQSWNQLAGRSSGHTSIQRAAARAVALERYAGAWLGAEDAKIGDYLGY